MLIVPPQVHHYQVILVNFANFIVQHGGFALYVLVLAATFNHANSVVKKEVSNQQKRNLLNLMMTTMNLISCVYFSKYISDETGKSFSNQIITRPRSDLNTLSLVISQVVLTDYFVKFGTVLVKIIITALPNCIAPYQKRGGIYNFIEYASLLYRCCYPCYPWLCYLLPEYNVWNIFLAGLYLVFKITECASRVRDLSSSAKILFTKYNYGTEPTVSEVKAAGEMCPICREMFVQPTRLRCSHIFCKACALSWFEREITCPICRATVTDDLLYRDGSTEKYMQLF